MRQDDHFYGAEEVLDDRDDDTDWEVDDDFSEKCAHGQQHDPLR